MTRRDLPAPISPPVTQDPYPSASDDQLRNEALSLGADLSSTSTRAETLDALARQKRLIASFDENVLVELATWAHLPLPPAAQSLTTRKENLARTVLTLRTMRFAGLSIDALRTLALLRGIPLRGDEPVQAIVAALAESESLSHKLQRKSRSFLGKMAEKFLAPNAPPGTKPLRHHIEDHGLLTGLSASLKSSADAYVSEKLDEIEARIDRKLDEIDRRLADWRDREIANRIRILKITLWASLAISALSLLYVYLKAHFTH